MTGTQLKKHEKTSNALGPLGVYLFYEQLRWWLWQRFFSKRLGLGLHRGKWGMSFSHHESSHEKHGANCKFGTPEVAIFFSNPSGRLFEFI